MKFSVAIVALAVAEGAFSMAIPEASRLNSRQFGGRGGRGGQGGKLGLTPDNGAAPPAAAAGAAGAAAAGKGAGAGGKGFGGKGAAAAAAGGVAAGVAAAGAAAGAIAGQVGGAGLGSAVSSVAAIATSAIGGVAAAAGATAAPPPPPAASASVAAVASAASSVSAAAAAATSFVPPPPINALNAQASQDGLNLDPSQVQPGLAQDGQAIPEAGQVPSLTSKNNFINFCATQSTVLTNGLQTVTGSCNPTVMGRIIAKTNLPSSKFVFPLNGGTVAHNTTFTIKMAITNIQTGNFVNAQQNYYAAPCQVNAQGIVIGHSHVVVEAIPSMQSTAPTDPTKFAFFKGLNAAAVGGVLTADVTGGLAPGAYRLASINTCANHQPVLGSVAQHGSFDDMVYFQVQ